MHLHRREHLFKWNGRPLKDKSDKELTIRSDSSLLGWGAACAKNRTGGAWSIQIKAMHINCLEFLAMMLAAKTFLDIPGVSVLLCLYNATAVAYINNTGGTVSSQLINLAKELWMWALNKDVILTTQHILGVSNTIADMESSHHGSIQTTECGSVCIQIDTSDTPLLQLGTRPPGISSDCIPTGLAPSKRLCQSPLCLIGRVMSWPHHQQSQLVLVAPEWRGQTWYPVLLEML